MAKAILLYGPSGCGKSALAERIVKEHGYIHCDADVFKLMIAPQRSRMRSAVGEATCFAYAKALIMHRKDIIIEAMPMSYLARLRRVMRKQGYVIHEVSLHASLETCLRNNARRGKKRHDDAVVRQVYPLLVKRRGIIIDLDGKSRGYAYRQLKRIL